MPLLQVRDFPEELYSQLRVAAKAANRSLSQQTLVVMRNYLDGKQAAAAEPAQDATAGTSAHKQRRREALVAIERFHLENPGVFENSLDPTALIREDRDHDRFESMELS